MELGTNQLDALNKVASAQNSGGFLFAKPKTPAYVQLEGKGLIEHNDGMVNEKGEVPWRLTTAGSDFLKSKTENTNVTEQTTPNAETATPAAAPSFVIATVALPTVKRRGEQSSKYPFDRLEPGQSFFVPLEGRKNLSKTIGSVVGKRNKDDDERQFTTRSIADGKAWGEQFAGVEGVAVFRLTPEQVTARDAK